MNKDDIHDVTSLSDKYKDMSSEEVYIKARDKAFKFLAYRARSSKEMIDKLLQEQFPSAIITRVLELLSRYDYINDTAFAQNYVESRVRSKGYGELRLRHELYQKGISKEIVNHIFETVEIDALETAISLLNKKLRGNTEADYNEKKSAYGFLARRGYSHDVISQAFKQYFYEP